MPFLEFWRVFTDHFSEKFVEIRKAFKPDSEACFWNWAVLEEEIFRLVNAVPVYEIREGHTRIGFKKAAESGCSQVDSRGHLVYVGRAVEMGFHIGVNLLHA